MGSVDALADFRDITASFGCYDSPEQLLLHWRCLPKVQLVEV